MLKHLTFIVLSMAVLLVSANMSPSRAEQGQPQSSTATAIAAQRRCPGALVDVTVSSSSAYDVACAAARQAIAGQV